MVLSTPKLKVCHVTGRALGKMHVTITAKIAHRYQEVIYINYSRLHLASEGIYTCAHHQQLPFTTCSKQEMSCRPKLSRQYFLTHFQNTNYKQNPDPRVCSHIISSKTASVVEYQACLTLKPV